MAQHAPGVPAERLPSSMRTFGVIWFGQLISTLGSGLTGFALTISHSRDYAIAFVVATG